MSGNNQFDAMIFGGKGQFRERTLGSLPENELAAGQTRAQRSNLEWHIREAQCERRQRRRHARIGQMPVTDPEPFVFCTLVELVNDFTQRQRARAVAKEEAKNRAQSGCA